MFIAREKDLESLQMCYDSSSCFGMAIIYGRRRVGKTRLIEEFVKDKKNLFFSAVKTSNQDENLLGLSKVISGRDDDDFPVYSSFSAAFNQIAKMAENERLVFVIDEFPYLENDDGWFSSLLQNTIDREFRKTKLFLIICGSSVSFMEEKVLGSKNPLYGRTGMIMKLLPFDYYDTARWFPSYSSRDKAIMYGVTGGIPYYLEQFSPDKSVKENLLSGFFNRNSVLFNENEFLLKEEVREPSIYNAVITAIANGKTKFSEIADSASVSSGALTSYLKTLKNLGIVSKVFPVGRQEEKNSFYVIDDLFFRFWHFFVPRNYSSIISGRIRTSYEIAVERLMNDYMGKVFERICTEYLEFRAENLPFPPSAVGTWWGGNPKTKKSAEIDIVVTSAIDDDVIIGSCKFTNLRMGIDELRRIEEYADAMGTRGRRHYYFFSAAGFDESFKEQRNEYIHLVGIDELFL